MDFVFKMMNFVFTIMEFALKMLRFISGSDPLQGGAAGECGSEHTRRTGNGCRARGVHRATRTGELFFVACEWCSFSLRLFLE